MRLISLVLALVALLAAPAVAVAVELRFITIEAAPWASVDPSGRPVGAFAAIIAELERRTGDRIAITLHSFARIDRELEAGTQDCTIILWNESRARLVEQGEAVYPMQFGVIARTGIALASYDDLRPLTISVVRNLGIDPRFDADGMLQKDFDKDYLMGLRKIAHGRINAIAGALPTIRHIAETQGIAHHLGQHLVLTTIPLTLQCSKNSPNLASMARLNEAIRAMKDDGTLVRVLAENYYH
jgi:polar amino acid transport system substrate-binding protein